ncbi:hypothetical protein BH11PSE5_BH11PSE5_11280 [soil metagenome]
MAFVSVTRLRVRSLRFMPGFFLHAAGSTSQIRRADGFIVGSLLRDRRLTFWTMTVWHGQADMRRYITNGAHFKAMPKLMDWCDEASVVHWEQPEEALAGWEDADQRMRVGGSPVQGAPSQRAPSGPDVPAAANQQGSADYARDVKE